MQIKYNAIKQLFTHETSIKAGFAKDHENLVCEFHAII